MTGAVRPLVSVLIITYNQQDIVRETIESCFEQTYANFEIVVSDDGSSDDTPNILKELVARSPHPMKLVLNPINQGITANCNAGLAACTGSYIALMGGDDLLLPEKLSRQVEAFESDSSLVLSYHPCFVLREGVVAETVGDRPKDVVRNLNEMISNFGAQLPGPATMVRRSAIPRRGFRAELGTASDWMYFIDVSANGSVTRLDEPLAIYRQHGGNVGQRYFSYSDDFLRTLELARQSYGNRPGIERAIRKGGTRFLLGIMYRAIAMGRRDLAVGYARKLSEYSNPALAASARLVAGIPGTSAIFARAKNLLKRYV